VLCCLYAYTSIWCQTLRTAFLYMRCRRTDSKEADVADFGLVAVLCLCYVVLCCAMLCYVMFLQD
jgi:hypothetical protein